MSEPNPKNQTAEPIRFRSSIKLSDWPHSREVPPDQPINVAGSGTRGSDPTLHFAEGEILASFRPCAGVEYRQRRFRPRGNPQARK